MALMTLNSEIMAFGYSGMLASHKPEQQSSPARREQDQAPAAQSDGLLGVRSLLVRLRNRRA